MQNTIVDLKLKERPAQGAGRYNLYRQIHRALRSGMGETLAALGRVDLGDEAELAQTLGELRALLELLRSHLEHENRSIHRAMHDRLSGSADKTAADHVGHERAIARLETLAGEVESRKGELRGAAAETLYLELAGFVAENLEHMTYEETENNAVLWATHSDEELRQIERSIVAQTPPQTVAAVMRWMIPSITPAERVQLLTGIRETAPAQVFEGVAAIARRSLSERDWYRLATKLGIAPMAA